jgi:hypothetical protein
MANNSSSGSILGSQDAPGNFQGQKEYVYYDKVLEINRSTHKAIVRTPFAEGGQTREIELDQVPPYMKQYVVLDNQSFQELTKEQKKYSRPGRITDQRLAELTNRFTTVERALFSKINVAHRSANPLSPAGRKLMRCTSDEVVTAANETHISAHHSLIPLLKLARDAISKTTIHEYKELQEVYSNIQTDDEHLQRLMRLRPLFYYGVGDKWMLRNFKEGTSKAKYIETVSLTDYLHPEEAVISGYFGMKNSVFIINDGGKYNGGEIDKHMHKKRGTVFGLVGARMEVPGEGDWHTLSNSLDKRLLDDVVYKFLCGQSEDTYAFFNEELLSLTGGNGEEHSTSLYITRTALVLGQYFSAAAKLAVEPTRVVVTGLGLGHWSGNNADKFTNLFVHGALLALKASIINMKIEELLFAYVESKYVTQEVMAKLKQECTSRKIKLIFENINPLSSVKGLGLISCYAWDGMSYQGNEYWDGLLDTSMDPATIAATTIAYLGVPEINKEAFEKVVIYD